MLLKKCSYINLSTEKLSELKAREKQIWSPESTPLLFTEWENVLNECEWYLSEWFWLNHEPYRYLGWHLEWPIKFRGGLCPCCWSYSKLKQMAWAFSWIISWVEWIELMEFFFPCSVKERRLDQLFFFIPLEITHTKPNAWNPVKFVSGWCGIIYCELSSTLYTQFT